VARWARHAIYIGGLWLAEETQPAEDR
jgi:hypothetical protein